MACSKHALTSLEDLKQSIISDQSIIPGPSPEETLVPVPPVINNTFTELYLCKRNFGFLIVLLLIVILILIVLLVLK